MTETFDIAIVGAGITGCAIARQLTRFELSICVVEAANDIALGASKANGGLVHAGYDPAPGTVKAQVNARGCELYGTWAQELGFLFSRTGSMVLGFNDEDRAQLEQLRCNGHVNGVPELAIIGPERIHELEPRASVQATCALWCPSTGYVDPFEVAIAALENAVANGVTFMRSAPVEAIEVAGGADGGAAADDKGRARFTLVTPAGDVRCRYLINAAGNGAADISHMAGAEEFQMVWRQGNIVVMDKEPRTLMPLYPVPTPVSKGVIVTGTVHGNTVITATAAVREPGDTQTYASDVDALLTGARKLVPDLDTRRVVRAFAGGRPVIQGTNDFFIGQSAVVPGLFQAAGIQSPGVASAPAIAERIELVMREAGVELHERADWNPIRRAPDDFDRAPLARKEELIESDPAWGQIVCRCETVPEAEIVAAIRRQPGAVSVEGVKRRCRAGMGRCQSGFCQSRVVAILARELDCDPSEVLLEDAGSWLVEGPLKGGALGWRNSNRARLIAASSKPYKRKPSTWSLSAAAPPAWRLHLPHIKPAHTWLSWSASSIWAASCASASTPVLAYRTLSRNSPAPSTRSALSTRCARPTLRCSWAAWCLGLIRARAREMPQSIPSRSCAAPACCSSPDERSSLPWDAASAPAARLRSPAADPPACLRQAWRSDTSISKISSQARVPSFWARATSG